MTDVDKLFQQQRAARDAAYAAEQQLLDARARTALIEPPESAEMFRTRGGHIAVCMGSDHDSYTFLAIRRDGGGGDLVYVRVTFSTDWTGMCNDTNVDVQHAFDLITKVGKLPL